MSLDLSQIKEPVEVLYSRFNLIRQHKFSKMPFYQKKVKQTIIYS